MTADRRRYRFDDREVTWDELAAVNDPAVLEEIAAIPVGGSSVLGQCDEIERLPDAVAVDDLVRYAHPSWGPVVGRVLRIDGKPDHVLVQDLSPNGAREWWPTAKLVRTLEGT